MSDLKKQRSSSLKHVSFAIAGLLDQFYISSFTVRVIFYYENELFLSILWIGIAFLIYGFWNMINDPLLGWLSDKKTRFTERWGRRFPWFLVGAILTNIVYFFIYAVPFADPKSNQIAVFLWLLVILVLFELVYSLWQVNWLALYPDLLRSQKERTKVGALNTIFAQIGTILGIFITPLFIVYGDPSTYLIAAFVVSIIGFIIVLLLIPGMKEDDELIQRELQNIEEQKKEQESYWQVLKATTKQKNFMAYVFMYMFYYTVPILLMSSLPFLTIYIIKSDNPTMETLIAAGFLIGAFVGVPIWLKMGRKYGTRKCYIYGSLLCIIFAIPLLFATDFILIVIFLSLLGASYASIWTLLYPGFSEVIDEIVVTTGKRKEGAYTGVRTFIGRLAFVIQALAFAIVHTLTNFKPGAKTQEPLAIWGIRFIYMGIPLICFIMCFILIFFFYDLTPEKVKSNKEYLRNAGL